MLQLVGFGDDVTEVKGTQAERLRYWCDAAVDVMLRLKVNKGRTFIRWRELVLFSPPNCLCLEREAGSQLNLEGIGHGGSRARSAQISDRGVEVRREGIGAKVGPKVRAVR
jgi:hypothetical protein